MDLILAENFSEFIRIQSPDSVRNQPLFYPENLVLPRIAGSSMGHVVDPAKRESEIDGSALEFCV